MRRKVPENGKTKCSKCGKEFEGKFCPECGTKSGASPAPVAKPESKLRNRERICMIIAAIAVIVVIGMAAYNLRSGRQNAAPEPTAQVASIDWTGVELKDALPTLPSDNGKIYQSSAERLRVSVNGVSAEKYNAYIFDCIDNNFTVEIEKDSNNAFSAYNAEGYHISLSHTGDQMEVELEAPMDMGDISWPDNAAGELLPTPQSLTGKFTYKSSG